MLVSLVDNIVVAVILLVPSVLAYLYSFIKRPSYLQLINGVNSLKFIPVSVSLVASFLTINYKVLNADTFGPDIDFYTSTSKLMIRAIALLGTIPLCMLIFVPTLHNLHLRCIFEYLELRFDSLVVRWMASFLFIIVTLGVTIFSIRIPCLLLQDVFGIPFWIPGLVICLVSTSYVVSGGLVSVICCQICQLMVVLSAMVVVMFRGLQETDGLLTVVNSTLVSESLKFNLSLDLLSNTNDINILLGLGITLFFMTGTHQSHFERYSSVRSQLKAQMEICLAGILTAAILAFVFITMSTVLVGYSRSNDHWSDGIMTNNQVPISSASIFTSMLNLLKSNYGMNGLFLGAYLSLELSFVSSILNSLVVITMEDYVVKLPQVRRKSDHFWCKVFRSVAILYGVIITSVALIPKLELSIAIPFLAQLFFAIIAIIGSAFLVGMCLPFVNKYGMGAGIIIGFLLMTTYITQKHWNFMASLGFHQFSNGTLELRQLEVNESVSQAIRNQSSSNFQSHHLKTLNELIESNQWEYVVMNTHSSLNPCIGTTITIIFAILISILTGGCCCCKRVRPVYLHPILHFCYPTPKRRSSSLECPESLQLRDRTLPTTYRQVDRLSGAYNSFNLGKTTSTFSLFHQRYEAIPMDEIPQQ